MGAKLGLENYSKKEEKVNQFLNILKKAQGHEEMRGFWELMCQYRELTGQKGAGRLSENELGLMRDLNPTNEKQSTIMKSGFDMSDKP